MSKAKEEQKASLGCSPAAMDLKTEQGEFSVSVTKLCLEYVSVHTFPLSVTIASVNYPFFSLTEILL